LVVGRLGRPHGLQGELHIHILTDFPERLAAGTQVYIGDDYRPYKIGQLKKHGKNSLLQLDGVVSREAAALLRNTEVHVRTADLPALAEGEYYQHEVIGLRVVDEAGTDLGIVSEIISTGANDVLVVLGESRSEILIPRLDDVVLGIDLEAGLLTVRLPGGLIP
jgi:16S rRNA processing protein RimM